METGHEALALVVKQLDPLDVVANRMALQYLDPLSMDFDEAKMLTAAHVMGPFLPGAENWPYWSMGIPQRSTHRSR